MVSDDKHEATKERVGNTDNNGVKNRECMEIEGLQTF
jgi:hypothetical protein